MTTKPHPLDKHSLVARLGGPQLAALHTAGVALGIAVTAIACAMLVVPRVSAYVRSEQDQIMLAKIKTDIAGSEGQLTRSTKEAQELEALLADVVTLQPHTSINTQLAALAQLAAAQQVSLTSIQPGPVATTPGQQGYAIVPIRIAGAGSYPQMVAFLRELNATHRDMRVVGVSLKASTPAREGSSSSNVAYELSISWYTRAPQAQAQTQALPTPTTPSTTTSAQNGRSTPE